ncbi:hypothetical protein BASA62_000253 [Batrachochytrium salamandrivorans]|nr:hypothetical protein BASA62_000253 [Batrachochytrium salamandrivorans]
MRGFAAHQRHSHKTLSRVAGDKVAPRPKLIIFCRKRAQSDNKGHLHPLTPGLLAQMLRAARTASSTHAMYRIAHVGENSVATRGAFLPPLPLKSACRLSNVRMFAAPPQTEDLDDGNPLPHFKIKPALKRLPDVRGIDPVSIELPKDRGANKTFRVMMRAIDLEHRVRHDHDGRTQLISASSPLAISPGSIVLIEYVTARSMARKQLFAGVLMVIKRQGIMSSFTLRNYVMGTGVVIQFPVYSPMVLKIKVLQPAAPELLKRKTDDISWILKRSCPGVDYTKIDEMVARYRLAEDRLAKLQQKL